MGFLCPSGQNIAKNATNWKLEFQKKTNLGFVGFVEVPVFIVFSRVLGFSEEIREDPTRQFFDNMQFLFLGGRGVSFGFFVFLIWVLEGLSWGEVAQRATSHHLTLS